MNAWKTTAIFGASKCKTRRGPIRSWRQISCRFHQDSRVCLLRFNCSVSGSPVPAAIFLTAILFYLIQSRWRAVVASFTTRFSIGLKVSCIEKCFFVSSSVIRGTWFSLPTLAFTIFTVLSILVGTNTVQKCLYSLGFPNDRTQPSVGSDR